jgi:hypothetical protein
MRSGWRKLLLPLAWSVALGMTAGCPREVTPGDDGGLLPDTSTPSPTDAGAPPGTDAPVASRDVPGAGQDVPGDVPIGPTPDVPIVPPADPSTDIDLLIEVDNSSSMQGNQSILMPEIASLVSMLTNPPDRDGDGRPDFAPFSTVHVGVISSDLGTPGTSVPGCADTDVGDDGLLNPIRFGQALQHHEPWTTAPPGFRPADCNRSDQFPAFIAFDSGATDLMAFDHDVRCNAGLYTGGCGLEAQLESVWRAIVYHRADDAPGNTDPNAGFLRQNALLAIVVLTDEEDGSVRDCRYAEPGRACTDALGVYNSTDTRWAAASLNMRFYMDQPCGAQDPTWPLDRYVDPSNVDRGFLSVKPGHPERVLFAAITGIPLATPRASDGTPDWTALLGTPSPTGGPNDFCGRDSATAISMTSPEGPVSMRQAQRDPDPMCTERVEPACRREGTTSAPGACTSGAQYFAWPSRRVVEIARRFDEAPLCSGAPCHNGVVGSICGNSYGSAVQSLVDRIQARRH